MICDFGCSRLHEEIGYTRTKPSFTWPYTAPEMFGVGGNAEPKQSKESDVYAFGILVLKILTGKAPFVNIKGELNRIMAVLSGVQPEDMYQGAEYSATWKVVKPCIEVEPASRPTMEEVVRRLPQTRAQ